MEFKERRNVIQSNSALARALPRPRYQPNVPTVTRREEAMYGREKLPIVCQRPKCGEPTPLTRGLRKRAMKFVGTDRLEHATFLCPACGAQRRFGLSVSGPIEETTGKTLSARLTQLVLRELVEFFF